MIKEPEEEKNLTTFSLKCNFLSTPSLDKGGKYKKQESTEESCKHIHDLYFTLFSDHTLLLSPTMTIAITHTAIYADYGIQIQQLLQL